MEEYEYSFVAKDIAPYIEFCENNGYEKISVEKQNRVVYENKNADNLIARITTTILEDSQVVVFDCKSVDEADGDLKVSKESQEIIVTDENRDGIMSMLDTLGFYVVANNTRTRYEYKKDVVKFEIDDYIEPNMKVIAIEGDRESVNAVYAIVRSLEN